MKVCIAEKPSVAREIARIIGAKQRHDGFFEGNGFQVTWTFGHFCTLKTPDDYHAHWKKWDLYALPMLPDRFEIKLINNAGVKKQFGIIRKLFKKASLVINCGDAGQEGELIQRWVMKEAGYQGPVQRLWISSLTAEAIREGFQDLKPAVEYDKLYHAGFSRAIGDWLLGMNASRLYTLKYGGYKQLLSIGRVQTPTLAMLVKRHHEIQNFVPKTYWELQTLYRDTPFNCVKGKFEKKEDGATLLAKIDGKPFVITASERKEGKESPPRLFDLTSLQVHCNKRFAFSADLTLKIAQKLYEQKLITYPRVDTTYLPNDLYPKIPGILQKMTVYAGLIEPLLGKKIRKSAKVFNDKKVTDHHAIIPTGLQSALGDTEQKVYDSIARQFIAAFYPDCLVAKSTILGESEQVPFKATGKEILDPGWRVVFPKSEKKEQEKEEEKILPSFEVGESGPHEPSLLEKQTKPPKTYTEATLLRAMETAGKQVEDEELRDLMKANGIGRPSTRANIIETLFKRKYIRRNKKQILPTETGIQLIDIIKNPLLISAELTGKWEKQLRDIENGSVKANQFIRAMKQMVAQLVEEVRPLSNQIRISSQSNVATSKAPPSPKKPAKTQSIQSLQCPKCQKGTLLKGKQAYGCSQWKQGCDFKVSFGYMEKKLSEKQIIRLIQKGSTIELKGFKNGSDKVNGRLQINDQFRIEFKPSLSDTLDKKSQSGSQASNGHITCPKCQKGHIIKGKSAYGCSQWKEGCDYRMPFEQIQKKALGREITPKLLTEILTYSH